MKKVKCIIFFLSFCICMFFSIGTTYALEGNRKANDNEILLISVLEIGVVGMSYLASKHPKETGGALILLSPFSAANWEKNESKQYYLTKLITIGGMGAYNLYMHDKNMEEKDILKRNILAWHLTFAINYVSYKIFEKKRNSFQISISHVDNQGFLNFKYSF